MDIVPVEIFRAIALCGVGVVVVLFLGAVINWALGRRL